MAKLQTVEMKIPFAGFYNSVYSDEIDRQEEFYCERHCDESDGDESAWPEALQLDSAKYADILFSVTDYSSTYRDIARDYVQAFSYLAGEALGISAREKVKCYDWQSRRQVTETKDVESLRFTFADMTSPREYNFQTDRIFVNVPVSVVRKLWTMSKADQHKTLSRVAKERHSSRSGFISFYESDWRDWGTVATWDYNQLETLLIVCCEIVGFDWQDSDLGLYYATTKSDSGYSAWESAVDWQAYESKRNESRAEKLAAWLESDPDKARAWIGANPAQSDALLAIEPDQFRPFDLSQVPYRCQATPDLFA